MDFERRDYGAPFDGTIDNLPIGSYTIEGFDSYGDGWNGAVMSITDDYSGESYTFAVDGSGGSIEVMVTGECELCCEYITCAGCTDAAACNYDATATIDDGSCVFPGCTDAGACNLDDLAGCDDGSCIFPGCTDARCLQLRR